ncbi:MAG: 16S rRNA (guanine(966)-N(2))-methyltransferase RsmD [Acidimicrobiia bacterium]|nr:16S rRNA (guanine(966)-N(2))-methyltransferase RsmD [Acidimicrobiia bacterium]
MRVVAGTARGRRLVAPAGHGVRPTSDRVREAVGNALVSLDVLDGATVLDAFAGSGALGIEALSRGAAHAVFLEPDRAARRSVIENLATTDLAEHAEVLATDFERYCDQPLAAGFDIAFCDPPYATNRWEQLFEVVPARLVVAESDRSVADIAEAAGWGVLRERRYGSTFVVFARRRTPLSENP